MIPVSADIRDSFNAITYPTKDFRININDSVMAGFVDDLESVKQRCYVILNTERYDHIIYSWSYGVELKELIGKPKSYVIPQVKRRIQEALLQDDRITGVTNFVIDAGKNYIRTSFVVENIYGSFKQEVEVTI